MNNRLLSCSLVLHAAPDCGLALEVIVVGQHCEGAAREMQNYITGAIAAHQPAVLIINLIGFRYVFGDDVGGALVSAHCVLHSLGGPRMCRVVAQGTTAESLETLLRFGKILPLFGGRLFGDLESALSDARSLAWE